MQHLREVTVLGDADIAERLVKTRDRPTVHLLVGPVAAVHPHHRGLIAVSGRECFRAPESLRPVRGEPLAVIGMKAMTERMTYHLIGHHSSMPRPSQVKHALLTPSRLVNTRHGRES